MHPRVGMLSTDFLPRIRLEKIVAMEGPDRVLSFV